MSREDAPAVAPRPSDSDAEELARLEKRKNELLEHVAKSVLANGITVGSRYHALVASIGVLLIPAYATVVRLLLAGVGGTASPTLMAPIAIWVIAILWGATNMFPRKDVIDYKNLETIISAQKKRTDREIRSAVVVAALNVLGLVVAASMMIFCI